MRYLWKWLCNCFRSAARPTRPAGFCRPVLECLEERLAPAIALNLVVPPSSSYGVDNSLVIQYSNTGTTAVAAPLLVVSANNANLWLPNDPAVSGPSLQVLATGPTGPAGTLAPGASGSIVVDYTSTSSSASDINFSVGQLIPGQTINWSALESSMRPSYINSTAWNAVFANFVANVGNTTTSYQAALDADATYLAQLGEPTNDVARLVTYEINKANDAFSTTALGDTVDASLPTPGSLSLSFERWFQPGISGRDQMGTMGLGWTNNWDIAASTDSQGNVTIAESGTLLYFTLQSDGSYLGTLGDTGVLTARSGGGYQLMETDGSLTVFNANGTLNYVQDSNGNRITASYNSSGLLAQLTASSNGVSDGEYLTFTYTNGLLTKVADSTAESTTYKYDSTGQYLLSATNEYGTTSYSYVSGQGAAAQNALASIGFADGSHVYYSYDSEGRLIDEHQDNDQEDVQISYGAAGGYTTTDANTNKTTVLTDDSGEVCETIDPLGNVTRSSYDASGDLLQVQGPQGANYTYTYDANGNVLSETDPLGLTTTFTYNANNDLASYTDANGNTTSYNYDSSNDLLSITYADDTQDTWNNYNPEGEAAQYVDPSGQKIGSQYNAQGLLTEETFSDGSSYTYTYDTHGNLLTAASSAGGTIQFKYQDSANPDLLTEVLYPNGQYLKFSYNTAGQRIQSVDQTGYTINYSYDAQGRLSELTDGNDNLIVKYTYDAAGNLIQTDNGNGTLTVYTYDGDGDVLSITNYAPSTGGASYNPANSTVNSFDDYTYDALGNVLTDTNQDGQWVYTYDADSQLTHTVFTPNSSDPDSLTSQNLQYVYDADGNRISQTGNSVTTKYVVNDMNEYSSSMTNGVTTTYTYDNDGNLTAQTTAGSTTTYSYNDLNELTKVNGPGLTASYTYDPLGNRNSETVNGVTTQFLIDPTGLGDVVSTYTGSGSLTAHYTYGLGLVTQVSASGNAAYYDFNLTGDTVGITGATGSYVNKYSYLPFGQTTTITAALTNLFTFVGQFGVQSDGSGLYNMRAREYNSALGQFLSMDPLGLAGGSANVRSYVQNQPTSAIDPVGLDIYRLRQSLSPVSNADPDGNATYYNLIKFSDLPTWVDQRGRANLLHVRQSNYPIKIWQRPSGSGALPAPPPAYFVKGPDKKWYEVNPDNDLQNMTNPPANGGIIQPRSDRNESGPFQIPAPPPRLPAGNGNHQTFDPTPPLFVIASLVSLVYAQTDNTQASDSNPQPTAGIATTFFVDGYTASGSPDAFTPADWKVTTKFNNGVTTTDTVVADPEDPQITFLFYATALFSAAGQLGYTTYQTNLVDPLYDGTGQGVISVLPALTPTSTGGSPQYTLLAQGEGLQENTLVSDPPLAIIDTTDPSITSASQVAVSVGTPDSPNTPVPLVTGVTLTQLGGGETQIVVNGVVSTVQPGAGEVYAAPLTITLGNEPPLTVHTVVDETQSDYTVNPANVVAVAGQPLQNVQVATVTGPADGNYTATINWGDGETSSGELIALGGGEYSVVGSKPQPYASVGNETITVTVTGPGETPAAPAETTATVIKANQTIAFTAPLSPISFVSNETVQLSASGGASGNPVVFSIDPNSTGTGTINGNTLTVTGPGSMVLDANQAGNSNYNAAAQVQQTLVTQPIPYTPSGLIAASSGYDRPSFSWNAVGGAAHYSLVVVDSTTNTIAINDPDIASTFYTTTAAQTLTPGHSYTWYVGSVAGNAAPQYHSPVTFTLAALAAPTLTGPSGPIAASSGYALPTLRWTTVAGASSYSVFLYDATTGAWDLYGQNTGSSGSYTPSTPLTPGQSYVWTVAALSSNGQAATFASWDDFQLAALAAPTLRGPSGLIAASSGYDLPILTWTTVAGAASYGVFLYDATVGVWDLYGQPAGSAGSYKLSTPLTPGHSYVWTVSAGSSNGLAATFASWDDFQLAALAAPTLRGPSGLIAASSGYDLPTLTWNTVAGAASFGVYLYDATAGAWDLYGQNTGSSGSYKLSTPLTPGHSYVWTVAALSSNVQAATFASGADDFQLAALAAPTLRGPNSLIAASSGYDLPTLTWTTVTGAASYGVYLYDATAGAWDLYDQKAGSAGSDTLSTPLTPGHSYVWTVAALSSNGQGATFASNWDDFQLAAPAAP